MRGTMIGFVDNIESVGYFKIKKLQGKQKKQNNKISHELRNELKVFKRPALEETGKAIPKADLILAVLTT